MIGFFDSGFGGLTVLRYVNKDLPEYSTVYLGDNARTPYGNRSHEVIYDYTIEGVGYLLKLGCPLVVVACNAASAQALRRLQQEYLPAHYPDRRVLGVIRPSVEKITEFTKSKKVGILATSATVESGSYSDELAKIDPEIQVYHEACPLLVPIVEAGEAGWQGTKMIAKRYVDQLMSRDPGIDVVLLGCTHYPVLYDTIRELLPKSVQIYEQGPFVAEKLKDYLDRHPEIDSQLERHGKRQFLTTSISASSDKLSKDFYGEEILLKHINLKTS